MKSQSFCRVLAFFTVLAIARCASAQLLSPLLKPLTTTVSSLTCTLSAGSPKLDDALQKWVAEGSQGKVRVIVSAAPGLLSTVKNLLPTLGGPLLGELPGINALVTEVDSRGLTGLICSGSVSSISIDAPVAVTGAAAAAGSYSLRTTLGLPRDTPSGAGIGIAVVDSGIAASSDFGNRITAFFDFTNGATAASPSDGYGHGTHVAGLIAGSGSLSAAAAYQGVAPQVRLIGMKVLDGTGAGRTSDVVRAVEYATAHRSSLGIQVINLSLGHPIYEPAGRDPLVRAVENASRAGIIVVAAAGNHGMDSTTGESGYAGITSPGNAPSAITVGAVNTQETVTRSDDRVAPYSSSRMPRSEAHCICSIRPRGSTAATFV
jgi:serine protease AprX